MNKNSAKEVDVSSIARVAKVMDRVYGNWKEIIWRSFVSGIFAALGATVGVAIVIFVLSFVFDQLGVLPVIGDFFTRLNSFINSPFPHE